MNSYDWIESVTHIEPLSNDEQHRLLRLWQNKQDGEARDTLVMSHIRYVIKFANRYKNYGVPFNDLVQQCILGLMQAADKFDFDKLNKQGKPHTFLTYATWKMRRHIQDAHNVGQVIRKPKNANYLPQYKSPILFTDMGNEDTVPDEGYIHPDYMESDEQVNNLFEGIPQRSKSMVLDRAQGLYYKQIAKKHGICTQRVQQICEKTYKQIKKNKKQLT